MHLTSTQKLTDDAVDGTAGGDAFGEGCSRIAAGLGGCNLYLYDFAGPAGGRLRAVSVGGEVRGVLGIAEDGSRVYYVSRAKVGSSGEEGQPNLYVYDAVSGRTTFITTLGEADAQDWARKFTRPAQVAGRSGRFLLFASSKPGLTSDDTSSVTQLFEYQAPGEGEGGGQSEAAELVRVTQGEDAFNENGNGVSTGVERPTLYENEGRLGNGADFKTTANPRNISVDGRRVFFATVGR